MGLARFVATDQQRPKATEEELRDLLYKMDGVVDWTIHENGDVTVEYEPHRIGDQLIEDALAGIGFELHHIYDRPDADDAEVETALEQ